MSEADKNSSSSNIPAWAGRNKKTKQRSGRGPLEQARIAKRRVLVADMYARGYTQAQIVETTGVHRQTIYVDLLHIQDEWRKTRIIDFDTASTRELMSLDRAEREAWDAWERSKKARVRGSAGDPRYLATVIACIDRRCKLLGLDAPTKIAPTDPSGKQSYLGALELLQQRAREMPLEQLEALAALTEAFGPVSAAVVEAKLSEPGQAPPELAADGKEPEPGQAPLPLSPPAGDDQAV